LPNNDGVQLELYRDLTDGSNGGEWEKVFVFIRNDFIDQAQYKKFSIREIVNS
jgi:hypothetical protein